MRKAVGDDVELMCDCHGRWRPAVAIRLGQALEPYDLSFFEEPIPPDNLLALKNVRDARPEDGPRDRRAGLHQWGYRELIENQLVDIIQPDVCHDGGIKETLKIAAMAETYNIARRAAQPERPGRDRRERARRRLRLELHILEYALSPTRDECQAGDVLKAVDGRIELPTKPGLGIELDEGYLAAHEATGAQLWNGLYYADGGVADV